ncbi:hypothetical protein [Propioniciclava flava]
MKAALVTAYGHNPQYADAPEPVATEEEIVIDVLAAALAPRVRSQAAGSHYTSTGALPLIPGVDGVGALPDGQQVYFLLPPTRRTARWRNASRWTRDAAWSCPKVRIRSQWRRP